MAKIDTSKIEGYQDMTAEQKLAALEGFEYEDNSAELEKHKNLLLPYNKDIPKPIVEVLRKAAHPEKQQRYRNIVDFKNDFRKATNELNEKKNVSYTRTILFFILISLLLLIIGLIIYLI